VNSFTRSTIIPANLSVPRPQSANNQREPRLTTESLLLASTSLVSYTEATHIVTAQNQQKRFPFVTVKFAQSLDGRIATSTGDSRWISGPPALRLAHKLRREHDAIIVGIGTVLADDPQLTVRLMKGRDPLRVVVDSGLRTPLEARVLADGAAAGTLIAGAVTADQHRAGKIQKLGAEILRLPNAPGGSGIDITRLLEALGSRGINSVLVEGGKGIITSLLAARVVDRLIVVIAPKIIGQGTEAIGNLGITRLNEAITFSSVKIRRLGEDVLFDGRLKRESKRIEL
jgi:diaminohydroxyphosphoribosylaminopyrimidine deaminase / 5-amino-6-(5-phosphoribosylamino)uracil reductase